MDLHTNQTTFCPTCEPTAIVSESQDICSIQNLLEKEHCFVREVDKYLMHHDFLALRKKEMLYKRWLENVSRPLLQKVQDKIDNQPSEEIEKRKRKQLSHYIDYCNKKGSAFLDTFDRLVYDPFFSKARTDFLQVSLPSLDDPLLKDTQQRSLEARIIQQCDTGKIYTSKEMEECSKAKLPVGRKLLSPDEWLKVPSGYMESEIGQKRRQKMVPTRNVSSMDFRSWVDMSTAQANIGGTVSLPGILKKT